MQRNLQCRWRLPAPGRGFLQGELLQSQKLHGLALAGGKAGDGLVQPADLATLFGKVRFICCKSFMNRRQLRLAEPEAAAPTQAVELLRLQELTLKEAAARSGQSPSALKVALHRALRRLRILMPRS